MATAAAAAATKRFVQPLVLALLMGKAEGGPEMSGVLSETLRGRPTGRRGGELLPPAVSGFLKAAAAAFFVKRTAVRRLTPDGEPVSCGWTALGLVLIGVVGASGGETVSRWSNWSGVDGMANGAVTVGATGVEGAVEAAAVVWQTGDDAMIDFRFITLATRRFLLFGRFGVLPPLPLFSSESVFGVRVIKLSIFNCLAAANDLGVILLFNLLPTGVCCSFLRGVPLLSLLLELLELSLPLESESSDDSIGLSTPERPGLVGLLLLLRVAAALPPA